MQLEQLKQSQKELIATRDELKLTREATEVQSKTFENSNYLQIFSHQFERLGKLEESLRFKLDDKEASDYKRFASLFFTSPYKTSYPTLTPILEVLIEQIKVIQAYINSIDSIEYKKLKQLLQDEFDIHKKAFYDNKIDVILCAIILCKYKDVFKTCNSITEYPNRQRLSALEDKVLSDLIDKKDYIVSKLETTFNDSSIILFFQTVYETDEHLELKQGMKKIIWED